MIFLILTLNSLLWAQEIDTTEIKNLQKDLPDFWTQMEHYEATQMGQHLKYKPLQTPTAWSKIESSGEKKIHIKPQAHVIHLNDGTKLEIPQEMFARVYRLPDEHGFYYLKGKSQTTQFKIHEKYIVDVEEVTNLKVPPTQYIEATQEKDKRFYDKEFSWTAGAQLGLQVISADFTKDLLNDSKARYGYGPRYSGRVETNWNMPMQIGGILQMDQTYYTTSYQGKVTHSSTSAGPLIRSKPFDIEGQGWVFLGHFLYTLNSKMLIENKFGTSQVELNGSQLFVGIEHSEKNDWGFMTFSTGLEYQWWTIKNQEAAADLEANNKTNKAFILQLGQVF